MQSEIPSSSRKRNPREKSNLLSAALFWYMIPIFWKFYRKDMTEEDLYEALNEHKSFKLGSKLEALWNEKNQKNHKYGLHLALFLQFKWELLMSILLHAFCQILVVTLIPFGVGGLVEYFQNGPISGNIKEAYYYAGILFIAIGIRSLVGHPAMMTMNHICMKMRIACCALIYRKSLKLGSSALLHTTVGQIVNLASNDVGKFDQLFFLSIHIISAPIVIAIAMFQLYVSIGVSSFLSLLILTVPLQMYFGKLASRIRLATSVRTDERLRLMNEILAGINVIKMYTWEMFFVKMVSIPRRYEIKAVRARFYIEALRRALEMFITRTATFITIIAFVLLGNVITAKTAFIITATYSAVRMLVSGLIPIAIVTIAETYVSLTRIQTFLRLDEFVGSPDGKAGVHNGSTKKLDDEITDSPEQLTYDLPKLALQNVSVKWHKELPSYALQNISLSVKSSQLVALIGPVGSGKSTLFDVILQELSISSGILNTYGKISFASQEPWLFAASVRQNIIFVNSYEEDRYNRVINVCGLEQDFKTFPYEDHTIISESGKSLSGGQKARINLARCVYREADIYLLDDPLSAVDTAVGKHLYEHCIRGFLKNKICILVTHQLQYLKNVDEIVVLKEGRIVQRGTYDVLQNAGLDFAVLLKEFYPGKDQKETSLKEGNLMSITDKLEVEKNALKQIKEIKEVTASGSIAFETYTKYVRAGGGYFLTLLLILLFVVAYSVTYSGDYFVAYWVNLEQNIIKQNETITDRYMNTSITRTNIIYIYSGIILLTILFSFAQSFFYFVFVTHASTNLHNSMFEKITYATMRFFDINPTGRILNRFSKDIGIVDEYIPIMLMDVIQVTLMLVTSLVISAIINIWLILPLVALLIPFYLSKLFYINTSKGAKRVEGIARSPIFKHITESITGRTTIRAFGAQTRLLQEFDAYQDLHSSAWYIFISATRAFGLWLDVLSITFIVVVVMYFLAFSYDYSGGEIGLLITNYVFMNTILSYGMRQLCEFENNVVSVERVLEYTKVEVEPKRDLSQVIPVNWPELGKVIFSHVSLKYSPKGLPALKNIDLAVCPGEKIGVVGRTGAGKSSLIAALFQMYNTEGNIIIDNIDIKKVPLEKLRSGISIIPQQPVLFSGTLRKNLDPLELYDDDVLWDALEQVELKQFIENSPGGLSSKVQASGSNFSIGQKQLICFARAIARKNKILIMDEATANVDPHTDAVVQKTIRHVFNDCTVITIAHRLHTIIDCEKVLVMENGSAVEFDHPYKLLQNEQSLFYKMTQAAGKDTFGNLFAAAETTFKKHL